MMSCAAMQERLPASQGDLKATTQVINLRYRRTETLETRILLAVKYSGLRMRMFRHMDTTERHS